MQQLSKKLMSWASILEDGAREQALRTASLPFIHPWVALMPDAHQGKGSTIGSVIPTLGAIIPAAVGVDIGCFHGDTRVPLLDGTQRSLKDLAQGAGPYWVYSLNEGRQVVPGRAVALRTRCDADLVKVTISGGDEIICTPDHQFMMNDGTYRRAQDLRFNDSLMPLHCGEELANPAALRWHKHREHGYNREVISVVPVGEHADVYCLRVEKHHNFALAAGVFVHNCGMIAVRSQFTAGDLRARGDRAALRRSIERVIPLSAGQDNAAIYDDRTTARIAVLEQRDGADSAERTAPNWRLQLGSLGSGNHFIEVSLDEEDRVWIFLHSGSRGVGNRLARKHIKIAQNLARQWWIPLPDPDLAYLVEGTGEFWAYLRDLRWAQHFALLNREEMMDRAADCLGEWIGQPVEAAETVNTHHNYTAREKHFGKEVWVSRKGAIEASAGSPGLIPGSMGTRSYVVTGKGSRLALNSAPHGAGRQHSRSAARKKFSRAELEAAMKGIEWRRTSAFLDEIPAAYKSIDVIMNDARDLVEIRHTLRQVVNVKGD